MWMGTRAVTESSVLCHWLQIWTFEFTAFPSSLHSTGAGVAWRYVWESKHKEHTKTDDRSLLQMGLLKFLPAKRALSPSSSSILQTSNNVKINLGISLTLNNLRCVDWHLLLCIRVVMISKKKLCRKKKSFISNETLVNKGTWNIDEFNLHCHLKIWYWFLTK